MQLFQCSSLKLPLFLFIFRYNLIFSRLIVDCDGAGQHCCSCNQGCRIRIGKNRKSISSQCFAHDVFQTGCLFLFQHLLVFFMQNVEVTSIQDRFQCIQQRFIFDNILQIEVIKNSVIFQFQNINIVIINDLRN